MKKLTLIILLGLISHSIAQNVKHISRFELNSLCCGFLGNNGEFGTFKNPFLLDSIPFSGEIVDAFDEYVNGVPHKRGNHLVVSNGIKKSLISYGDQISILEERHFNADGEFWYKKSYNSNGKLSYLDSLTSKQEYFRNGQLHRDWYISRKRPDCEYECPEILMREYTETGQLIYCDTSFTLVKKPGQYSLHKISKMIWTPSSRQTLQKIEGEYEFYLRQTLDPKTSEVIKSHEVVYYQNQIFLNGPYCDLVNGNSGCCSNYNFYRSIANEYNRDDLKQGMTICYSSYPDKIISKGEYLDDTKVGLHIEYWDNGNVKTELNYKINESPSNKYDLSILDGIQKEYYSSGKIFDIKVYKLGKIISFESFYENGNLKSKGEY
jgi:antitoxin component YwqK of YwqJK toxin-antitoxin module